MRNIVREVHRPRRAATPPPTKIDRRAAADTMTSAQDSISPYLVLPYFVFLALLLCHSLHIYLAQTILILA